MIETTTRTLTFLMTDIEGSTVLWETQPDAMRAAMLVHDAVIENAVAAHGGEVVRPRGEGDSRFAVFPGAADAVRAAANLQRALGHDMADHPVTIRVRAGIHTGTADLREGDYYGSTVNRCARIRGLGHGGQTLLSQATAELVRDDVTGEMSLVGLGTHRLKGLTRPETVYQLWISDLPNDFPPLVSDTESVTNLPQPPTPLIGRERELADVKDLLAQDTARVVTLLGPGGTGKTRLSLEVGHALINQYPDGVFFVDLAPISDPALVASTMAHAMGIREGGGRPPIDNLKDFLANKQTLLILDNLEQVIAVAPIVADILTVAPRIKILATSRIPLRIRGEREYPLATLPVPPAGATLSPAELETYEAVRLFVRQAQAVRPTFELNADNAATVVEICRRLDGLPLALEIAAARMRMFPPEALLKRLDSSLNVLVGGAADLPSRQQTIRAAIDWSYDLLQPDEQKLFARLGVFVGGFTLETAEAVVNAEVLTGGGQPLDIYSGIEALLDNSLLRQVDSPNDEPRFDMLQTIRDYALEKLAESGEMPALHQAHLMAYMALVEMASGKVFSSDAVAWLRVFNADYDNVRAALNFAFSVPEMAPLTSLICAHMVSFWYRYGFFHEGREWSERSVQACAGIGGEAEAAALQAAATMAVWEGDLLIAVEYANRSVSLIMTTNNDLLQATALMAQGIALINRGLDREAYHAMQQSTELFDDIDLPWERTTTLVHLANAALGLGEIELAHKWLEMALPMAREIGDPWQIAFCLNNFGEVARTQKQYDLARSYYEQTEASFWQADAPGDYARLIHTAGYMALHENDVAQAEALFQESLAAFRKLGNKRGMAECLAGIAATSDDPAWAVPLLSAAAAHMTRSGAAWWPADRVEIEQTKHRLIDMIGEQEFRRLWESGQILTLDEGIAWATQHATDGVVSDDT